jgi:aspartyl/glutamyl-tRNA(Asn/Gln) amidotransferase C subunit
MDIEKLFKLSKIKLQSQRLEEMQIKLSNVLEMVDALHLVDCDGGQRTQFPPSEIHLRKDEVRSLNNRDDLFSNLPHEEREFAQKSGYYRVPKIVDK